MFPPRFERSSSCTHGRVASNLGAARGETRETPRGARAVCAARAGGASSGAASDAAPLRALGPHFVAWCRVSKSTDCGRGRGDSFLTVTDTEQAFRDFNQSLIAEFRANEGKVTGPFAGAPLLLITTTGAKSGRAHTTPLVYTTDGDRLVIIASKGGAPSHPAWYHNILANPTVTVEVPGDTFEARATPAVGAERDRLFAAQAALMPNFNEYQEKTTRTIPVVVLERIT
jgi:deazaflavin-dependent oxidoreductase (nitroreductase family)